MISIHGVLVMPSFFRSPLLHFLILGTLLFAARDWRAGDSNSTDNAALRITLEADRIAELQRSFVQQAGRRPEPAEITRMIEAEVDEEILYREAIARGLLERDGGVQTRLLQKMLFLEGGTQIEDASALLSRAVELDLHREDVVVRRILVQKMKLLGSQLEADQRVRDDEIAAAYRERGDSLRSPDRLTLEHVFLSRDRRGGDLERDGALLRRRLIEDDPPASQAIAYGDPFPLGHRLEGRSQRDLERTFGARFGESAFALERGGWSAPIESAYGLHLVRVEAREPGRVPPLEAVADRIRLQLEDQRRAANLEALKTDLRGRYEVVLPETQAPILESRDRSAYTSTSILEASEITEATETSGQQARQTARQQASQEPG